MFIQNARASRVSLFLLASSSDIENQTTAIKHFPAPLDEEHGTRRGRVAPLELLAGVAWRCSLSTSHFPQCNKLQESAGHVATCEVEN